MRKITKLCLTLLFASLVASCDISYLDREIEEVAWDGNLKIPAGFINYNLSEIFDDLGSSDLEPTSTEEFSFIYTETFSGENNDAFNVDIDDTTIESSVSSPITEQELANIGETFPYTITAEISSGIPNPLIGTFSNNNQKVHDLNLTQELTGVVFDGGVMNLVFDSAVEASIEITVTIPSFTNKSDGAIFTQTETITNGTQETISLNLKDYNADLTNDGTGTGKTNNKVVINVDAAFTFVEGNTLNANDAISYEAIISDVSYTLINGDFKQEPFNISSNTIDLGEFFDNFSEGDVSFENVSMDINVTSDYGFPISMDLSSITATGTNTSVNLNYSAPGPLPNTIIINGVENFGDAPRITNTTLDDTNSNIAELLESKPNSIAFDISGKANPLSNGVNENFFEANNNGFQAEVSIGFDKVSLDKEIDFDGADDLDDFESIRLVATVENKIPLTGDVLLEFKNDNNQVLHTESLTAFEAANVDQAGSSDGIAVSSNFEILLDQNEINSITNASKINIRITLELPTGRNSVLIKGSDELDVILGIEAKANITPEN